MPYSEEDWTEEREQILAQELADACPNCGRTGFYGPREAEGDRQYRMCKFCGFYQGVDEEPEQLRPCAHQCENQTEILGAPEIQWVSPDETTYSCFHCDEEVDAEDSTIVPPVENDAHPWTEVPQGLTYGQYYEFWQGVLGKPRAYL